MSAPTDGREQWTGRITEGWTLVPLAQRTSLGEHWSVCFHRVTGRRTLDERTNTRRALSIEHEKTPGR